MSVDPYQSSPDASQCGHPNQDAYTHINADGSSRMIVYCPSCGMEW